MLQEIETDASAAPAAEAALPPQVSKPASLTGALVQRGRERSPRFATPTEAAFEAAPAPAPAPAVATATLPALEDVPLVFAKRPAKAGAAPASRLYEALFFAACCAVFFATFLFVLRI